MSATLEFLNFVKAEWTERPGGLIAPASYTPKSGETTDEEWWDRAGKMQIEEEEARDERKAKYQEAKTKPGFLGRHLGYLTETGLESAAKQRAEGTAGQPQGPLQGSQAGVGTGKATGINRAKIAQKPLGTAGKIPSMSTKVKMNKPPKVTTPQQMSEMKMEKTAVLKLLKAVDDEYNTKGERREAKRRKDRKMKVTGTGVRTLQQIMIDRANKLKGQEGTE